MVDAMRAVVILNAFSARSYWHVVGVANCFLIPLGILSGTIIFLHRNRVR